MSKNSNLMADCMAGLAAVTPVMVVPLLAGKALTARVVDAMIEKNVEEVGCVQSSGDRVRDSF